MPAATLHEEGWRQGSLIRAALVVHSLELVNDTMLDIAETFDLWLLANQDCDLANTVCTNKSRQMELRPILSRNGEKLDGIRSRTILVMNDLVLRAESKKLTLTASALNSLKSQRENSLADDRRRDIMTWLGLRYDRPAVPNQFVELGKMLKEKLIDSMPDKLIGAIRDIFVYYEAEKEVLLHIITRDESLDIDIADWLDDAAEDLDTSNGVTILQRVIATTRKTPISILETYYGLDAAEFSLSNQQLPQP